MTDEEATYLIVGLGNPGREYSLNRHNVGFMLLDRLAARLGVRFSRVQNRALVTRGEFQGRRLILAKPQTFMNLSGQAAAALQRFYKVPLANVMVTYDEVDLPYGTLRLRPKGGSAGHRGMRSIIQQLASEEFPRLRLGVGRPPGRMQAADYVLQDFSQAELDELPFMLDTGVEAVLLYTAEGLSAAMNRFNGPVNPDEQD